MPPQSWQTHHSQREPNHVRTSYPERYIFLVLFVILFIRIMKTLQKYRPQERFDPALDELDSDVGVNTEVRRQPLAIATQAVYWDDAAGQSMGTSPGGTYHIRGRSRDDIYEAAVASLVSLQSQHSPITPIPEHRIRDLQRVQLLVAKLRTASYSAQNNPEDSPLRQEVALLRRQIAEIVLNSSSDTTNTLSPHVSSHPPPPHEVATLDPPPAYRDIVYDDNDSTAVSAYTQSSPSTPLMSHPESVL